MESLEVGGAAQAEGRLGVLPPASRELMEVLWSSPTPCTLGALAERTEVRFPSRRGRADSSIYTTLRALAEKGFVEVDTSRSNRHRYSARVSRGEAMAEGAEAVLDDFCHYDQGDGWYLVRAYLSRLELDELVPGRREGTRRRGDRMPGRGGEDERLDARGDRRPVR